MLKTDTGNAGFRKPRKPRFDADARAADLYARLERDKIWQTLFKVTLDELISAFLKRHAHIRVLSDEQHLAAVQFEILTALNDALRPEPLPPEDAETEPVERSLREGG
jgi:hypothetical protein